MRIQGYGTIADLLDDWIAYRSLNAIDARLPRLADLHAGPVPRKGEQAYAVAVAELLRQARALSTAGSELRRLIVIGDTARSDGGCFTTLCAATGWHGRALICDEQPGAAPLMRYEGYISFANTWQALYAFQASLEAEEFPINAETAVVLDIDKTLVGAKGRNHRLIDQARLRALRGAVAATLGERFNAGGFETTYRELDQARFHPLTEDNNDYVAYLCVLIGAGALDADDPASMLASGQRLVALLPELGKRVASSAPALLPFHTAIAELAAQGDPTPFKLFRRNEYHETAALFGTPDLPVGELLAQRIVLTGEVWEVAQAWRKKGALLFGLSDKPDEAAIPTPEAAAQGAQPLHRLTTTIIGMS